MYMCVGVMWPLLWTQTATTSDTIQGGDLQPFYPSFSLVTIFARRVYH